MSRIYIKGVRRPAILIPPWVLHRTLGKIRLLNIPIPPFDPEDELFD